MSYTRISVPARGFKPSSTFFIRFSLVIVGLATFSSLVINYISIDRANRVLALKLNEYAGARPVSAIKNPERTTDTSQALIPVDRDEVQTYLEKIQSMVIVPTDEAPTLATVVATDALREQAFFRFVELQDKLFLYDASRIAILYRPSEQKIVNMAYLFEGADRAAPQVQGTSTASAQLKEPATVAVYYSTDSAALRSKVGETLRSLPSLSISREALTRETSYEGMTVIDVNGSNDVIVKTLVDALDAEVGQMPEDEDVPDADMLIIAAP